ncbi:MAG: hypothetical protein JOZ57_16535, partial [Abitibacteriaceae bacterium]|nr:hypothetical protein [Abditibacteriaceae bacterium]
MNTPEARRNALEWLFVALPFCLLILWRVGWVLHLTSHPANPAHPVDITQLVEVLLYFGLCAIIFWWYYSAQWKAKLLKSLPLDISFVPLSLQDYSQLDFSALLRSTADLESAGFTQAGDYEMQAFYGRNVAKRPPKMMRVFLHHEHRCLAVIAPSLAPSQNGAALTAIQCTILSYLSRNSGPSNDPVTPFINSTHQNAGHKQKQKVPRSSETWSLSTLNYQPPAITYILRQPRSLWVC